MTFRRMTLGVLTLSRMTTEQNFVTHYWVSFCWVLFSILSFWRVLFCSVILLLYSVKLLIFNAPQNHSEDCNDANILLCLIKLMVGCHWDECQCIKSQGSLSSAPTFFSFNDELATAAKTNVALIWLVQQRKIGDEKLLRTQLLAPRPLLKYLKVLPQFCHATSYKTSAFNLLL